ncbi:MAG: glycosyltransferase [Bacteroidetes bacterium]|nr:glycosyltransferase [Bacteroidota bacterium]
MIRKNITILVYLHNNRETVEACLNSILNSADRAKLKIFVIDDGSTDGSYDLIKNYNEIEIVQHGFLGIAKSVNQLLPYLGDDDLVRINADVVIKSEDWLEQFQSTAYSNNEIGIVGARLLLADNRIESDGRNFITGLGYEERHLSLNAFMRNEDCKTQIVEVDSVSSAFCYYKNETIKKTGLFDENYFPLYSEDDDYCIAARRNNSSVVSNSSIQAYHFIPIKTPTDIPLGENNKNFESILFDGQKFIQAEHFKYWKIKWGWDLKYPGLNLIRELYGNTKICWNIGDTLRFKSKEEFPAVDICIVTCNNLPLLKRMMESLFHTDYPKEKIKVYITDNGSKDGTVEYLNQLSGGYFFEVHNEFLPINSGVAYGLNLAVIKGKAELVARLDDDIILPANWLKELVKIFSKRPYCGMTGPKILNDNSTNTIQCSDFRMFPSYSAHENEIDNGQADYISRTVHIKGCCNLYRRDVFINCGLFDIRFSPSQFDDPDHQIAVLARGYEIIYNGHVGVIHKINSGVNNSYAGLSNMQANQHKLYGKWGSNIYEILDKSIEFSFEGREIDITKQTILPAHEAAQNLKYNFTEEFIRTTKNTVDYKMVNKHEYDSIVELFLANAVWLYKPNSLPGTISYLHTALSQHPSKIATILFLHLAYLRLGDSNKAKHFKILVDILNRANAGRILDQIEHDNSGTLSDAISKINIQLEHHTAEEILERFILNNQFVKAEMIYSLLTIGSSNIVLYKD